MPSPHGWHGVLITLVAELAVQVDCCGYSVP